MDAAAWIDRLALAPDPAGGWSRVHHTSPFPGGPADAVLVEVRYHLLTAVAPRTRPRVDADTLLIHHAGGALQVRGESSTRRLGPPTDLQTAIRRDRETTLELGEGEWALFSAATVPARPASAVRGDSRRPAPPPVPEDSSGAASPVPADSSGAASPVPADSSGAASPVPADSRAFAISPVPADSFDATAPGPAFLRALDLAPHPEGGHFRRTWEVPGPLRLATGPRPLSSSIYYLLTADARVGHFHRSGSSITHCVQSGGPIHFIMISPDGDLHERSLGRSGDHDLAFTCPPGWWKASWLPPGVDHGLITEVVAPAFDYADHTLADAELFARLFPQHRARWTDLVRSTFLG